MHLITVSEYELKQPAQLARSLLLRKAIILEQPLLLIRQFLKYMLGFIYQQITQKPPTQADLITLKQCISKPDRTTSYLQFNKVFSSEPRHLMTAHQCQKPDQRQLIYRKFSLQVATETEQVASMEMSCFVSDGTQGQSKHRNYIARMMHEVVWVRGEYQITSNANFSCGVQSLPFKDNQMMLCSTVNSFCFYCSVLGYLSPLVSGFPTDFCTHFLPLISTITI